MIVLGADTHKRSHTIAAVAAATGELVGEKTVAVGARGFGALVIWARGLAGERVWALEDCRHVSGSFERFLIARGERVRAGPDQADGDVAALGPRAREVRQHRRDRRRPGGAARRRRRRCRRRSWTGPSSICGCWSITASAWSASGSGSTTRCSGTCTISGPSSRCRAARCSRASGAPGSAGAWRGPSRRCASGSPATSCAACANSPRRSRALEAEIAELVARVAPQLLSEPGFGPLTAAKLVGEIAGADRFATDAKLARAAGLAPIPVSSGQDQPPPTRSRRQPPDQRRDPPRRRHPRPLPPRDPRLHRPQDRRRQDPPRSHPLPQTPPRPPHLAPPATAPPSQGTPPSPSIS